MTDLRVRVRIDLGPGVAIGPGKVALLEALDRTGSLSQAARELAMSYRRAWLLLKSLNELYEMPLATSVKGGAGGGGAKLTPVGRAVIDAFHAVEHAAAVAARAHFHGGLRGSGARSESAGIRRLPLSTAGSGQAT